MYIEQDQNYSSVYLDDDTLTLFDLKNPIRVKGTLKKLYVKICGKNIVKTHRKFIVNMDRIKLVHLNKHSNIIMADGKIIEISRSHKKEFLNRWENHVN